MNLKRWLDLMSNFGFDMNKDTYSALEKSYSEKHRHYHNTSHITAVLKSLNESKVLTNHANELELALWFHDAIYKPLSSTNELDSANWAADFLKQNKADEDTINKVYQLIMATLHDCTPKESDDKLIVDIDLAILGSSKDVYDHFEKGVRKEYKFVPMALYSKKRKEILESFLSRERIYSHDYFYDKLEQSARDNIRGAIQSL